MLAPADNAALTGELAEYLVLCMRHALDQGVGGWCDDMLTYTRPWGFDLTRTSVPVALRHGTDDVNLGPVHAGWLGDHIPGARTRIVDRAGHISLLLQIDRVLDDLLDRSGLKTRPEPSLPGA
jgi:pimeloyl-ACP methyl ester carboxylesterase